jgi:hypothetical protein
MDLLQGHYYEPKNGVQKSGGPTQSPGPLGVPCSDAQLVSATQASAYSARRNHGERDGFCGFCFMMLMSWV